MVLPLLDLNRDMILGPLGLLPLSRTFFFEIVDMIIMAFAIGYLFSGYFQRHESSNYDPLRDFKAKKSARWQSIKFAAMVAAPAVILHELLHKGVAMAFGAQAVLYAPYGFYLLIIILKLIGFPLLFFVGGYVAHSFLPPMQSALVSIAGPLANFILWAMITYGVKANIIKNKQYVWAVPFAKINLFLGIFNMFPFPGFDGFNFLASLYSYFF